MLEQIEVKCKTIETFFQDAKQRLTEEEISALFLYTYVLFYENPNLTIPSYVKELYQDVSYVTSKIHSFTTPKDEEYWDIKETWDLCDQKTVWEAWNNKLKSISYTVFLKYLSEKEHYLQCMGWIDDEHFSEWKAYIRSLPFARKWKVQLVIYEQKFLDDLLNTISHPYSILHSEESYVLKDLKQVQEKLKEFGKSLSTTPT